MLEVFKTGFGIAAGVAGLLFIGYCIYFDKERRKDPDYKRKVHERRMNLKQLKEETGGSKSGVPNLQDQKAIERYFLQEIQMGETQIAHGDFQGGVEHLANAVAVCGQPARLLQVLQTTVPAQVFAMLIMKLREIASPQAQRDGPGFSAPFMVQNLSDAAGSTIMDDLE